MTPFSCSYMYSRNTSSYGTRCTGSITTYGWEPHRMFPEPPSSIQHSIECAIRGIKCYPSNYYRKPLHKNRKFNIWYCWESRQEPELLQNGRVAGPLLAPCWILYTSTSGVLPGRLVPEDVDNTPTLGYTEWCQTGRVWCAIAMAWRLITRDMGVSCLFRWFHELACAVYSVRRFELSVKLVGTHVLMKIQIGSFFLRYRLATKNRNEMGILIYPCCGGTVFEDLRHIFLLYNKWNTQWS